MGTGEQNVLILHCPSEEGLFPRFFGGAVGIVVYGADIALSHFPAVVIDNQTGGIKTF